MRLTNFVLVQMLLIANFIFIYFIKHFAANHLILLSLLIIYFITLVFNYLFYVTVIILLFNLLLFLALIMREISLRWFVRLDHLLVHFGNCSIIDFLKFNLPVRLCLLLLIWGFGLLFDNVGQVGNQILLLFCNLCKSRYWHWNRLFLVR